MTTESMHAFIEEANQLYLTDPAGAVALLYEGAKELKRKPSSKGVTESKTEKSPGCKNSRSGFPTYGMAERRCTGRYFAGLS